MSVTHIAVLAFHGRPDIRRAVIVPPGQSLNFDDGTIERTWLRPYLGTEWHLVEFLEIATAVKPEAVVLQGMKFQRF